MVPLFTRVLVVASALVVVGQGQLQASQVATTAKPAGPRDRPACATNVVTVVRNIVRSSGQLVSAIGDCPITSQSEIDCALELTDMLLEWGDAVRSISDGTFNCGSIPNVCAQLTGAIFQNFGKTSWDGVQAARFCPRGTLQAVQCFNAVVEMVRFLIDASKNVDAAIDACAPKVATTSRRPGSRNSPVGAGLRIEADPEVEEESQEQADDQAQAAGQVPAAEEPTEAPAPAPEEEHFDAKELKAEWQRVVDRLRAAPSELEAGLEAERPTGLEEPMERRRRLLDVIMERAGLLV